MRNLLKALFLLPFILIAHLVIAQNQTNIWYFSPDYAGVSFNSGVPKTLLNSAMHFYSDGGSACVSDTNGNILFYSEGETIWNRNDSIMLNGTGLEGDNSASQPALIVQKPGTSNTYYLFTIGSRNLARGLKYNIINMKLDNWNGSVVEKNQPVTAAVWARDKLTAVKHANGIDYWIISYDILAEKFYSFLLTSQGINPSPIISNSKIYNSTSWYGPIKAAPDGEKIISCTRGVNGYGNGSFEVCDFDKSSGKLISKFTVKESVANPNHFAVTGLEISPDSKLLYITSYLFPPGADNQSLLQYDLTQTDSVSFLNSSILIDTTARIAGLQLAPDGKIYGVRFLYPNNDSAFFYLDVINSSFGVN